VSVLEPGWGDDGGRPSRAGLFFIGIWTVFLLQPLQAGWDLREEPAGWVGMAAVLAFTAWYLAVFAARRMELRAGILHVRPGPAALKISVALALAAVVCVSVGQPGTACAVYISVMCAMTLPTKIGVPAAILNAVVFFLLGVLLPTWRMDGGLLLGGLAATMAVWGIQMMMIRNAQLVAATSENRRLAVSEERNRFARDLHDILGHSLTVITVKAELANRVFDLDPQRARAELADLERLSRDALADVRRRGRGLPRTDLAGGVGQSAGSPRRGADRSRPAELHRRHPDRATRAVRLGCPRGSHQRDPAFGRIPLSDSVEPRSGRGERRRPRRGFTRRGRERAPRFT